jgi:hypothetical protein
MEEHVSFGQRYMMNREGFIYEHTSPHADIGQAREKADAQLGHATAPNEGKTAGVLAITSIPAAPRTPKRASDRPRVRRIDRKYESSPVSSRRLPLMAEKERVPFRLFQLQV